MKLNHTIRHLPDPRVQRLQQQQHLGVVAYLAFPSINRSNPRNDFRARDSTLADKLLRDPQSGLFVGDCAQQHIYAFRNGLLFHMLYFLDSLIVATIVCADITDRNKSRTARMADCRTFTRKHRYRINTFVAQAVRLPIDMIRRLTLSMLRECGNMASYNE